MVDFWRKKEYFVVERSRDRVDRRSLRNVKDILWVSKMCPVDSMC